MASSTWISSTNPIFNPFPLSFTSHISNTIPTKKTNISQFLKPSINCSNIRELRERINSVKNTQKLTEAMKLVAAAKIRRAQESVINSRPFTETLVDILFNISQQILRALQESFASELAARMNAMSSATDNAVELKRNLSMAYNRKRQAKITGEILEIVAGADALT